MLSPCELQLPVPSGSHSAAYERGDTSKEIESDKVITKDFNSSSQISREIQMPALQYAKLIQWQKGLEQ